jgi:DNA-binding MarR family transcriptional regulator
MKIEEAIKQSSFENEHIKAVVNILYTGSWLSLKNAELLKPYNLTLQQYNVLRILRGQHPEPATVNLLIDRMLDKTSNASRIVDKLISKKLANRKHCETDRRCVDVIITDKGLKILAEIDKDQVEWLDFLKHFTKADAKKLNELLDKVRSSEAQ